MVFNTLLFLFITDPAKVYYQSPIFHRREMGRGYSGKGFPGSTVVKNPPANVGDASLTPG